MQPHRLCFLNLILVTFILLTSCNTSPTAETQSRPSVSIPTPQVSESVSTADITLADSIEERLDHAFQDLIDGMDNYNAIGLDTLNTSLRQDPHPFLLDIRSTEEIEETGYIEGAVTIPLKDLCTADSISMLPDFNTTIITYCGTGLRCTIAMTALGALGWDQVFTLQEGSFSGWASAGYPIVTGTPESHSRDVVSPDPELLTICNGMLNKLPEDHGMIHPDDFVQEFQKNPQLKVIDVRRTEEIARVGYIKNSIHIPLEDLIKRRADWPLDRDEKIFVYCSSGYRSTIAMTILWAYGYKDVHSLLGGIGS